MLKAPAQDSRPARRAIVWAAVSLAVSAAACWVLAPVSVLAYPLIGPAALIAWVLARRQKQAIRTIVIGAVGAALLMPFGQAAGFRIFMAYFADPSFSSAVGNYLAIFTPAVVVLVVCTAATIASLAGPGRDG